MPSKKGPRHLQGAKQMSEREAYAALYGNDGARAIRNGRAPEAAKIAARREAMAEAGDLRGLIAAGAPKPLRDRAARVAKQNAAAKHRAERHKRFAKANPVGAAVRSGPRSALKRRARRRTAKG